MTHEADTLVCPKGHASSEPDYCSECGARIGGARAGDAPAPPVQDGRGSQSSTSQVCPDCGTSREQTGSAFCEVCGYNFSTGAHGELNLLAASDERQPLGEAPVEPEPAPVPTPGAGHGDPPSHWAVEVSVNAGLRRPESPEPPGSFVPFTVELDRPVTLIGRPDEARAIRPEIALPFDEAVSRRHALLQRTETGGLSLRDIGSANGTRLNGKDVEAMLDTPLTAGDEITLGHWSRLTVQASS